jgi:hypothetical protein
VGVSALTWQDRARALVESAPAGGREALVAYVARYLESAHAAALAEGRALARVDILREQLAIVRGREQACAAEARTLERELAEASKKNG